MQPLVSAYTAVFNGAEYLSGAVESLLDQSFRDFEYIIVDDGSTDSTWEIIERYARLDERITPLRQARGGAAAAANAAIARGRARYLARLDHDDISLPLRLERQLQFLESNPEIAVLGCQAETIDSSGRIIAENVMPHMPTEPLEATSKLAAMNTIIASASMSRTDVLRLLGGYRTAFEPSEDYDLWLRVADKHLLTNLPDTLVYYRVHDAQSAAPAERKVAQALAVVVARRAAAIRRATGQDPIQAESLLLPSISKMLGTTKAVLEEEVAHRLCEHALYLLRKDNVRANQYMDLARARSRRLRTRSLLAFSLTSAGFSLRCGAFADFARHLMVGIRVLCGYLVAQAAGRRSASPEKQD